MIQKGMLSLLCVVLAFVPRAIAYGPKGHALVGAIADQRLATKPVAATLANLLDGLTLAEAALLPDNIKEWDHTNPRTNPDTFHLRDHPVIDQDLMAFWEANRGVMGSPSHHSFHYTDVPITGDTTYGSGQTGRSQWDIVHMIPYCIKVLKGTIPEDNERKITKRVAVILLAHFVGDIHQPLHVGAVYFDENGQPLNPDMGGPAFGDEGGNYLLLVLQRPGDHGHANATYKLHAYWDDQAVDSALILLRKEIRTDRASSTGTISPDDIARRLAAKEPANWALPATVGVEDWAVRWADEILPVAREAHDRLEFAHIRVIPAKKLVHGQAIERPQPGGQTYPDWAGQVVRDEIHKAGWRLAALLETVVH